MVDGFWQRSRPATRGESLSRKSRNPLIESVKKIMGSESFESADESSAQIGA